MQEALFRYGDVADNLHTSYFVDFELNAFSKIVVIYDFENGIIIIMLNEVVIHEISDIPLALDDGVNGKIKYGLFNRYWQGIFEYFRIYDSEGNTYFEYVDN